MNEIDTTTIFLIILFILPGFVAFSVSNSLYRKSLNIREIEVTYKSLLYSCVIYIILKIFSIIMKKPLSELILNHVIATSVTILGLGLALGILIFKINSNELLYQFLKNLKLMGQTVPPNLYAALMDPAYEPRATKGLWIRFEKTGVTVEGFVAYVDVASNERLIFIQSIREIDINGNILKEYPETYGMIVNVTTLEGLDIIYPDD